MSTKCPGGQLLSRLGMVQDINQDKDPQELLEKLKTLMHGPGPTPGSQDRGGNGWLTNHLALQRETAVVKPSR